MSFVENIILQEFASSDTGRLRFVKIWITKWRSVWFLLHVY